MEDGPSGATGGASYYLADGVRRAIAAREGNISILPARLKAAGMPDRLMYVSLDQLYSPKKTASASDPRLIRVRQAMQTPAGRAKIPPLEIEILGAWGQSESIPLRDVVLTP